MEGHDSCPCWGAWGGWILRTASGELAIPFHYGNYKQLELPEEIAPEWLTLSPSVRASELDETSGQVFPFRLPEAHHSMVASSAEALLECLLSVIEHLSELRADEESVGDLSKWPERKGVADCVGDLGFLLVEGLEGMAVVPELEGTKLLIVDEALVFPHDTDFSYPCAINEGRHLDPMPDQVAFLDGPLVAPERVEPHVGRGDLIQVGGIREEGPGLLQRNGKGDAFLNFSNPHGQK